MQEGGDFILDIDASNHCMCAVLSQVLNGKEKVIAYASRALGKSQLNYCMTKKELLAVVTFVEHFRRYFHGRHFVVRTDHASLKWLDIFKDVDGMLSKWLAKWDVYDNELVYRRGALHGNADGLSRKHTHKFPRDDCPQCTSHQVDAIIVEPDGHDHENGSLVGQ